MWDLESDFPLNRVNFGGLNFYGGSIPAISSECVVWYLWICSLGMDLAVQALDLMGRFFTSVVTFASDFARKSPS